MKKILVLSIVMACISVSTYAYICSGVTYTSTGATATLCAEDYNPSTVGGYPTIMNVNLTSGVTYVIEGRVELEQVEGWDVVLIQELDATGNVLNTLASYSAEIQNNIHLYARNNTGKIAIKIYCEYGATCETSGFEFTIRPIETMDTEQMFVTDRLGIGTTSPTEALDVRGKVKISDGSSTIVINPNNTQITITSPFLFVNKPIMNIGEFRSGNTCNLTLSTYTTPRMTILNSNGNVGIGTETPQKRLHIEGGALKIGSGTDINSRNLHTILIGDSTYVQIGEWEADNMLSFKANRYNFSNGNVGIGINNPQKKLHVVGGALKVGLGADSNSRSVNKILIGDSTYIQIGEWEADDMLSFKANKYNFNNGNVGIGTSDPQYKLDVNGTIRANEILVNTPSGADFVFDNDYNLRSLQEVKTFINTNKHLPEIPSAEEMQQNGVSLDKLVIQLLQKVEELTLYTIQQEQTIEELRNEIKVLKK